jgi:hypothetical protein
MKQPWMRYSTPVVLDIITAAKKEDPTPPYKLPSLLSNKLQHPLWNE